MRDKFNSHLPCLQSEGEDFEYEQTIYKSSIIDTAERSCEKIRVVCLADLFSVA